MSKKFIEAFEAELKTPVILVAASTRPDVETHLGHDAARFLRTIRSGIEAKHVTIVFVGSGGETAFAEHAWHALTANGGTYDVVVTDHISGGLSALALGAKRRLMMDGTTIGAFDIAPTFRPGTPIDADGYDDVPALGGLVYAHDPELPARLAWGYGFRRRARNLVARVTELETAFLSFESVGRDGGRNQNELNTEGWDAERFCAESVSAVLTELETELGLRAPPIVRYEASDLAADEVEFEMAMGLTTGIVASKNTIWVYERDTGSPDPDTGEYRGVWRDVSS